MLTNDVLFAHTAPDLARYSYTHESNNLRRTLARHLNQTRGVNCLPEQVVVQAGTDGALATILQLLDCEKHAIGLEEPGYATVREVVQRERGPFTCSAHRLYGVAAEVSRPSPMTTSSPASKPSAAPGSRKASTSLRHLHFR